MKVPQYDDVRQPDKPQGFATPRIWHVDNGGAAVGQGLQNLASGIGAFGEAIEKQKTEDEVFKAHAIVNDAHLMVSDALEEAKQDVLADGSGYRDGAMKRFNKIRSETLDTIKNPKAKQFVTLQFQTMERSVHGHALTYESKIGAEYQEAALKKHAIDTERAVVSAESEDQALVAIVNFRNMADAATKLDRPKKDIWLNNQIVKMAKAYLDAEIARRPVETLGILDKALGIETRFFDEDGVKPKLTFRDVYRGMNQNLDPKDILRLDKVQLLPEQDGILKDAAGSDADKLAFLHTVLKIENRGNASVNNAAVSPAGAAGAFQFMPKTAQAFGLDPKDRGDFKKSAAAASRYYDDLSKRYGGDMGAMLAEYNGGGASGQAVLNGKDPSSDETRKYIAMGRHLFSKMRGNVPASADANNDSPHTQHPIEGEYVSTDRAQQIQIANRMFYLADGSDLVAARNHAYAKVKQMRTEQASMMKLADQMAEQKYKDTFTLYEEYRSRGIQVPETVLSWLMSETSLRGPSELLKLQNIDRKYDANYVWRQREKDPFFGYNLPPITQQDLVNRAGLAEKRALYESAGAQTAAKFKYDYQPIVSPELAQVVSDTFMSKGPAPASAELAPLLDGYTPLSYSVMASQIAKKNPIAGAMIGALYSGDKRTAQDLYDGHKILSSRGDKAAHPYKDAKANEMNQVIESTLGDIVTSNIDQSGVLYQAIHTVYAKKAFDAGKLDGALDTSLLKSVIAQVVGEIGTVNGAKTIIPRGYSEDKMLNAIRATSARDVQAYGGVYYDTGMKNPDGSPVLERMPDEYAARLIATQARPVKVASNEFFYEVRNMNHILENTNNVQPQGDFDPTMTAQNLYGVFRGNAPGAWVRLVTAEGKPLRVRF